MSNWGVKKQGGEGEGGHPLVWIGSFALLDKRKKVRDAEGGAPRGVGHETVEDFRREEQKILTG